tara:strand:- start:437 stop:583 length:147 start_codon:yes stop_codon:yes gene_type:complete
MLNAQPINISIKYFVYLNTTIKTKVVKNIEVSKLLLKPYKLLEKRIDI